MISQKAKYAFKALAYLAGLRPGTSAQIEGIAATAAVPRKFLEHILLDLKRNGVVASRRGRSGGYVLIKPPAEITIGQILRAIDGPIAPLPCISRTAYRRCADCSDEKTCVVRKLFADTYAATLLLLDGTTLAEAIQSRGKGPEAEAPAPPAASRENIPALLNQL
jgi:Rrf2 family protein